MTSVEQVFVTRDAVLVLHTTLCYTTNTALCHGVTTLLRCAVLCAFYIDVMRHCVVLCSHVSASSVTCDVVLHMTLLQCYNASVTAFVTPLTPCRPSARGLLAVFQGINISSEFEITPRYYKFPV